MRPFYGLTLLLLAVSAGELQGQAQAERAVPNAVMGPRPLAHALAMKPGPLVPTESPDSTRRRPFYLPGPGERTAYWVGFGAGLAVSPLLWCDGPGCGTVDKAATSLGLGVAGALSGLLLSRAF